MKKIILSGFVLGCFSVTWLALGDGVLIKQKAKDLRDKLQADGTNQPPAKTNAPVRPVK